MKKHWWLAILLLLAVVVSGCGNQTGTAAAVPETIPPFSGEPFCILNDNIPEFSEEELTVRAYERYAPLDRLGRCGPAMACLGPELMPTQERESISEVKPSGWKQASYDCVNGGNLYNRCHLIGFQLAGENANERNLITGTRFLNVEGMLPFENMIADYIRETGNHVMYRVTPIFTDDCLVAEGVRMEAYSVEDSGYGICFHVYAYNYQPGVLINYKTGESVESYYEDATVGTAQNRFVLNVNSKKFHLPECDKTAQIKAENKQTYEGTREDLLFQGFVPAGCCNP